MSIAADDDDDDDAASVGHQQLQTFADGELRRPILAAASAGWHLNGNGFSSSRLTPRVVLVDLVDLLLAKFTAHKFILINSRYVRRLSSLWERQKTAVQGALYHFRRFFES